MVGGPARLTAPATAIAEHLPGWVTLVRAPNPGPMTLDGTNTWVLRAAPDAPATVIDPGPADARHLAAVLATGPVRYVLVTHHHADHVAGLPDFLALSGAAVVEHAGDLAGIGVTPVETPGHTADSRCFDLSRGDDRLIATGDTILGRGTAAVAWPDGDLRAYLASLAELSRYVGVTALTGHGPPLADTGAAARHYAAHRQGRLAQVRAAVAAGAGSPEAVVAEVYADVPPPLRTAALWSARAQLDYLAAEGR